jgi:hypothetical protein
MKWKSKEEFEKEVIRNEETLWKFATKELNWEESKKEYFLRRFCKQMFINWNRPKQNQKN